MNVHPESCSVTLDPPDNQRLANLCGQYDEHLRQIEKSLGVEINNRGGKFQVLGDKRSVHAAGEVLKGLYDETREEELTPARVNLLLQESSVEERVSEQEQHHKKAKDELLIKTRRGMVKGRGPNQNQYLGNIQKDDINFGIGPAGTGKTYLAVACAVEALENEDVRRIVLVRPAVEAGERLGFLPGDLAQKIDPYLRPLYDALYEMLGFEQINKLLDRNVIEVAPLAYMRGRTLNESFVILDEAQNTTVDQMKMFLTRIGFGSKAVITGDVTQIDLPSNMASGLRHVVDVLKDVKGIGFTFFSSKDVVRHPLVQRIVEAYESYENDNDGQPE